LAKNVQYYYVVPVIFIKIMKIMSNKVGLDWTMGVLHFQKFHNGQFSWGNT